MLSRNEKQILVLTLYLNTHKYKYLTIRKKAYKYSKAYDLFNKISFRFLCSLINVIMAVFFQVLLFLKLNLLVSDSFL